MRIIVFNTFFFRRTKHKSRKERKNTIKIKYIILKSINYF